MQFRYQIALGAVILALLGLIAQTNYAPSQPSPGVQNQESTSILFENVRIFNGTSNQLSGLSNVLVVGNKIKTISHRPIATASDIELTKIQGNNRTLMPGLIDNHVHLFMITSTSEELLSPEANFAVMNQKAQAAASQMLLRGFTSVRDLAGPVFDLKKQIDTGDVMGPRIYPSGAMISQTGGHGDYRTPKELVWTPYTTLSHSEVLNSVAIADGVDELLRRTREQLMQGATQIKLAAGGGVISNYDPLDVSQYTKAELHAAVEAAEDWNTYVTVHAYTPRAIQKAIRAGVKCIEHGQLMDEATAKIMAEKDIWLSIQPFLNDEDALPLLPDSTNHAKQLEISRGTDTAYTLAKKYNLKTAWGTDLLFDAKLATRQGAQLTKMLRWYTPAEVLKMATNTNAQLLALSGPRNPYQGKLGVVEEGALADLLLVDGDPLKNIKLIENPDKNFIVIMKDGKIYKNLLR